MAKKPFEVKHEKHGIFVEPFHLFTEERLEARHEFDRYIKDKELRCTQLKKEEENLTRKANDEAVATLRKKMVHKAQPIRHYKEVTIMPSGKITVPMSPSFMKNDTKNKENIRQ